MKTAGCAVVNFVHFLVRLPGDAKDHVMIVELCFTAVAADLYACMVFRKMVFVECNVTEPCVFHNNVTTRWSGMEHSVVVHVTPQSNVLEIRDGSRVGKVLSS